VDRQPLRGEGQQVDHRGRAIRRRLAVGRGYVLETTVGGESNDVRTTRQGRQRDAARAANRLGDHGGTGVGLEGEVVGVVRASRGCEPAGFEGVRGMMVGLSSDFERGRLAFGKDSAREQAACGL